MDTPDPIVTSATSAAHVSGAARASLARLPQAASGVLAMQRVAIAAFESRALSSECTFDAECHGLSISVSDGVGIIRISAPLVAEWHYDGWFVGYNQIANTLNVAFSDPRITAILLHIDSPGGEIAGLADFCSRFSGRNPKRVVVYGDLFASAAYTLAACVANSIVLSPTGVCGHVGVYRRMMNYSRALESDGIDVYYASAGAKKTEGFPDIPMTEAARESAQVDVDHAYEVICSIVARGRGVSVASVKATEAAVYVGESAVSIGFVDSIGTFADAFRLAHASRVRQESASNTASTDSPDANNPTESNQSTVSDAAVAAFVSHDSADTIERGVAMNQGSKVANAASVANESGEAVESGVNPMPMNAPSVEIEIEPDMEPMPQFESGDALIVSSGPLAGMRVKVISVSECSVCYAVSDESGVALGDMCESMLTESADSVVPSAPMAPMSPEAPVVSPEPAAAPESAESEDAKCKPAANDATAAATRLITEAAMHPSARSRSSMVAAFVSSTLSAAASVTEIEAAVATLRQSDPALFGHGDATAARVTVGTPPRESGDATAAPVTSAAIAPEASGASAVAPAAGAASATMRRGPRLVAAAPRAAVAAMAAPATRETHATEDSTRNGSGIGVGLKLVGRR